MSFLPGSFVKIARFLQRNALLLATAKLSVNNIPSKVEYKEKLS